MLHKIRWLFLVVLVGVGPIAIAHSAKNRQDPKHADQDEPLKLRTELVSIFTSVTDQRGRPIRDLKAADFTVFEDDARQRIEHFEPTEGPFTIMLLLDLSGSTRSDIGLIKNAAANFLRELRANDRVGVIVFSKEVELVSEIGDPRSRAEDAVRNLKSEPGDARYQFTLSTGTSFYDAVYLAADEPAFKKADGRKAIICLSDGVDSTSQMSYSEITKPTERSGASLYFLELNTEEATLTGLLKDRSDPSYLTFSRSQVKRYFDELEPDSIDRARPISALPVELRKKINGGLYSIARRQIRDMTSRAGGRVYPVRSLTDLDSVYREVADDLRAQYLLGYYPLNSATDGRWRAIRVAVKPAGANVRSRSGYWAPGK